MKVEEDDAGRRAGTPKGSVSAFTTIERSSMISQPPIDRSWLFFASDAARRSGAFRFFGATFSMRMLITGICGFVGSRIALWLNEQGPAGLRLVGIDNLSRPGSASNLQVLQARGIDVQVGDQRDNDLLERLGRFDWVIDAAAYASVLAGTAGHRSSSAELVSNNLQGTCQILELCKRHQAGLILLSTSRVYSIERLNRLPLVPVGSRWEIDSVDPSCAVAAIEGWSLQGIDLSFSTGAPISLYGATKLASEVMAIEYGVAYQFPVWVDRCGVMAGAGQFGRIDQGIVAYWLHRWREAKPLRYLGFGGMGWQVRDMLHPEDLAALILKQIHEGMASPWESIWHVSGGRESSFSLAELSEWCEERWGQRVVEQQGEPRSQDVPWLILDAQQTHDRWNWTPRWSRQAILEEIADHADTHPDWLAQCEGH
jgi:CDP-paratose 2-epimerase